MTLAFGVRGRVCEVLGDCEGDEAVKTAAACHLPCTQTALICAEVKEDTREVGSLIA